jgi:hypothetical protein
MVIPQREIKNSAWFVLEAVDVTSKVGKNSFIVLCILLYKTDC